MSLTQLSTPLSREQAESLVDAIMEDGMALSASAHEDSTTGEWVFEATVDGEPDLETFKRVARAALDGDVEFELEPIDPEINWVVRSLDGLQPVRAGGFFIHGSHAEGTVPAGLTPIRIDAAEAFGTGHHETTTGCLDALDRVLRRRKPQRIIDVGTGTGVLAIAIAKRTRLPVIASDIDPVAVRIAQENARANGVANQLVCLEAAGLDDRRIVANGPYDLIVANILAGPLVELAPSMGRLAARGCYVILAGLLATQAARVIAAYQRQSVVLRQQTLRGEWAILTLEKV